MESGQERPGIQLRKGLNWVFGWLLRRGWRLPGGESDWCKLKRKEKT